MRYEYSLQNISFKISHIDIITVSRDKSYKNSYMDGRPRHAFIYTERGRMLDDFLYPAKASITAEEGALLFVPKGARYYGTYLEDNTLNKIIQFKNSQVMIIRKYYIFFLLICQ